MGLMGLVAGASTAGVMGVVRLMGDNPTVALLSLEIGRIEREWVDEAKSYPRRARN